MSLETREHDWERDLPEDLRRTIAREPSDILIGVVVVGISAAVSLFLILWAVLKLFLIWA